MKVYRQLPPFTWLPQERPALHRTAAGGKVWEYAIAEEDDVIDFSVFNFAPQLVQGWLFAGLESATSAHVPAELITVGPARLWLNGELITHFAGRFSYVAVQRVPVTLALRPGFNELYVQGDMLGWRETRLALGLRLAEKPAITICIPLGGISAAAWQRAERGLNNLRFRQFAVPKLPATISLDSEAEQPFDGLLELSTSHDPLWTGMLDLQPIVETRPFTLAPGQSAELPLTARILEGMARTPGEPALKMTIRPADGTPSTRQYQVWASALPFSREPYGSYETRRQEALEHLAAMPYDVLTSMAAVMLGKSKCISSAAIERACFFLINRYDCADFYAIGLLALLYRFGNTPALQEPDRKRIEDALLKFKFWIDEPGIDAMCYFTENHQVLFHVAQYLSGQRYPNFVFKNSGLTGRQQKQRARSRIESWILRRLQGNFSEWDSNAYMALDVYAMLALVEFADSSRLRDLATAMLHKLFFLLACQSFRGAQGCTHGRCYASSLKSARVENTSGLQRIAWGMGIFNGETRATGLLAMAERYRVPEVLQQIGMDTESPLVTRARSKANLRPHFDMKPGTWDIRTITRRTSEVMLAAAVDHCPGTMGIQEHLWQATLSPEAVVFTTYPGNSQEHGNARPNFWAGSARLPRVGMVDRTVICLYRIEPGVGLGFTHAYFPTLMFDEYHLEGHWVFARVGDGYVALWGDGPLVLTESGRHAGQELRSTGAGQVWLCHVGSRAEDGSFEAFARKLLTDTPQPEGLGLRWKMPDGRVIAFGWEGPLTVDGRPEDWQSFPHYENAYTSTALDAEQMTIRYGGQTLTLDLKRGMARNDAQLRAVHKPGPLL